MSSDNLENQATAITSALTQASATQNEPTSFPWSICENLEERQRIQIKEAALDVGFSKARELVRRIDASLVNNDLEEPLDGQFLGKKQLKDLVKDFG